jgi:hypothetical protein
MPASVSPFPNVERKMSEAMDFAVPLSLDSVFAQPGVERPPATRNERLFSEIVTNAVYRFYFAPLRWLTGVDSLVKSALMFFPGVFLLSQVSATPNLRIQVATAGTLLAGGGIAFFVHSLRDFLGGLTIDAAGITARRGLFSKTLAWSEIKRWNVDNSAANMAELSSIQLWSTESDFPQVVVPGSFLSENEHRLVRQLLLVFAPDKEKG